MGLSQYNLEQIIIPTSVIWISNDAFANCDKLTIYSPNNSYAEEYANKNNIRFETLT